MVGDKVTERTLGALTVIVAVVRLVVSAVLIAVIVVLPTASAVTSPEEVEPVLADEVLLVDAELGHSTRTWVTPDLINVYRETFRRYCAEIEGFCRGHGWGYLRTSTQTPLEDLMLKALRVEGLLR